MGAYDLGLTYNSKNASPRTLDDQTLREILVSAGWRSGKALGKAFAIVGCESSKQTAVTSSNPAGGQNIGLFQIWEGNVSHPEYLKDPVYNANVARRMYLSAGGTFDKAWECSAKVGDPDAPAQGDEATNATDDASRAVTSGLNSVEDLIHVLGEKETWQRVGVVIIGGVLLTVATLILAAEFMRKVPTPVTKAFK